MFAESDLCDGRGAGHSQGVSAELLVLMMWTVQPPQVCLAVEWRAHLKRRGGRCRYVAQGQGSLVGDTGPWHGPPGGQSLELGMDLGVRRGHMWAKTRARDVGRVWGVRVGHVHARVLRRRKRVGEWAGGSVLAWVTRVNRRFRREHGGRRGGRRSGRVGRFHLRWVVVTLEIQKTCQMLISLQI